MDYYIINSIIKQKNYSLWRHCKNKFDIIKNEHGTYDEFNDFIIKIELCENNNNIKNIDVVSDNKDTEKQIKKIVNEIIISGNAKFDKFCIALLDYNI